ncbi:hypothetical protein CRYUN_Cryun20dG0123900 [Craigia yunnanensis]
MQQGVVSYQGSGDIIVLASHTLLSMINAFPILFQTKPDGKRLGESFTRLDQNSGPIEKFKLAAYCYPDHSDLDEWIIFPRVKELHGCIFKLPSIFRGFNCLKSLYLTQNLKYLEIDSEFEDISLESSPLLASVDIRVIPVDGTTMPRQLEEGNPSNLIRVLGCLYGV